MLYGIARVHFPPPPPPATILSGPYLWNRYSQRLQIECAAWSCGLIVHCCLPSNLLYFIFFLILFFRHDFVRAISLEPLLTETPNWVCCLVLQSNFALLLTIQFSSLFFFSLFFSAKILSGPYLWNRYSQRLQIECAAWSCCLILHCCLPSNSLYIYFFFFRHNFVRAISLEPLLAETPNWVCCLVLRSNFALLLTIQFALLFFILFFRHNFVRAISLEPLLAETPNWVCCLVLWSNFALLLTIQFALFFIFFPPRFSPGHISGTVTCRDSKLSVLLGPAV